MMTGKATKKQSTSFLTSEIEHGFAVSLMEHLVVPTFVLDMQCRVLIWNRACERLTGIAAADVLGTSDHWRGFYDEPRPCLADLIAQNRASETHAFYPEYITSADMQFGLYAENWCVMPQVGTKLYLAIDAGPIYNQEGELIAVVETLRDMTAQKQAQIALQELAAHDGLTSLANRRSFDENIRIEWRRSMRDAKPLSLLMVDVDHFKDYNDTYGHQAGDECLKSLARTMSSQMRRASDVVARYGGEEFAIVLPHAPLRGATVVAERIRSAVELLQLPNVKSETGHVTVSIGIATATPIMDGAPEQLIAAADGALYQAKHTGRNRACAIDVTSAEVRQ